MTPNTPADPRTRRDVRNVGLAIWIGIAIGLIHSLFVFKYPLLSMYTVHVLGLMVILAVGIYAAFVALTPARGDDSGSH